MSDHLPHKMTAIADRDKLPKDHDMRRLAFELDDVIKWSQDAKKLLGAWARARKCYCEYTGEPLI